MSFKKIVPEVRDALAKVGVSEVSAFGEQLLSSIKSGRHVLAIAPKKSGKTETAIVASFDKVNKELDGSPRIIIVSTSIDESIRVHEIMSKIAAPLDVTVDLTHDKGNQVKQRNEIFDGTEIIVGTVKRIHDLYVQNGINFKMLDYFIIDDLEEILSQGKVMQIKRLIEGLNKAQIIGLVNQRNSRIEQFIESVPIPFLELEL